MCQRKSIQGDQYHRLIDEKQQLIKQLTNRLNQKQDKIVAQNKEIDELNEIKKKVKRLPYRIIKEFIIMTQQNGTIIDLTKKKSFQTDNGTLSGNQLKKQKNYENYEQYLLLKIKGQKQDLYLSGNTEISTVDKLHIQSQERKSYEHLIQLGENSAKQKSNRLQIDIKVIDYKILNKVNKLQLSEQQKKLLIFPPSNATVSKEPKSPTFQPNLQKKQSLPLNTQCQILSQQLKQLKQKIGKYMKILEQKSVSHGGLNDLSQISVIKDNVDQQLQDKINQISNIDYGSMSPDMKWKQQKSQYIDYIQNLQKQVRGYRNYQFSFTDKDKQTSQKKENTIGIQKTISQVKNKQKEDQDKSPILFSSKQYSSQIRHKNNLVPPTSKVQKFDIFNQDLDKLKTYYKNQYHVNEEKKSNEKLKHSKIIYLRR